MYAITRCMPVSLYNGQPAVCGGRRPRDAISGGVFFIITIYNFLSIAGWRAAQAEARRLDAAIEANLRELGYGG